MASSIASSSRRLLAVGPQINWRSSRGMATRTAAPPAGDMKAKAANSLDMVAVCVPLGIVLAALTLGASTAKGQLVNSPSVRVSKKRRGTVPEVEEPEHVAGEGSRYVSRSFFRKVANVQDFDTVRSGISDPTRPGNVYRDPRQMESLKSVGVDPSCSS